ncbi:hypothetical protein [Salibacterium qingdaonense]|uniref:Uncharacterized protein n=1 Tax=Salibacterium qingdaonense TaxID=266892 RepID=A0A1I4NYG6_9BACI|nr:hypothetical protein [Salibacterium qingdaonense]SFM20347.1 hypothetical protein SAMN04488054_12139 [Salibacterium qingdaonense]
MEEVEWFIDSLETTFQISVDRKEVSYEGTELYLDEIDPVLVPTEILNHMPIALLFETMIVVDKEGTEWLGAIALHPTTMEWCLQVMFRDGQPVYRRTMMKED